VNIACHVKQSSKTTSFGGTFSWRWRGGMSSVRVVQTATTRILRHRFPGASETVGQVFKFVSRLRWKINAVCMSLSPLVSFKSRFVTYLLNFPRIILLIKPTWCTFFLSMFISFRYMFRANMCPSSRETTVFMRHLVLVILYGWLSGIQGGIKL